MLKLRLDDNAPWKQRFRAPWIALTQLAKSAPERGLAVSNQTGVFQVYAWEVPTGKLTQLTDRPEGVLMSYLSPDGRYVYYLDDQQGNEIGHFVRVPWTGGPPQDITPELPPYSPAGITTDRANSLLGLTAGTPDGFHLYCLDLEPDGTVGIPRLLYRSRALMFGPVLSQGGEIAIMASTERTGRPEYSLLAFNTATGEKIGELWDGENSSIQPVAFSPIPGDYRLLATTNRSGIEQLLLWNPRTNERTDLHFEGIAGSLGAFDWSPDGERILFRSFNQAIQQFYIYNLATDKVTRLNHPSGTITGPYFVPDSNEDSPGEIFAHLQDSTHPTRLVALDAETGEQVREVLAAGKVPPGRPWQSVTFTSSDGQEIQGWLAVPEGEGPFPTILEMHGGPTAVQVETFSAGSQAWLDHGFAFLTINYRGSTTFGREFEHQIVGDLGHWEVEDMVAARNWLAATGIADPDQILLCGWSYGGYLTLMGLGKRPDLWAGGMAGIAIADWAVQYEDSAEVLRGYQVAMFGGTPEEQPERYVASSPITYAEHVRAPVLIIQGRNDTRTPARPIEMYEAKMKALGKSIQVHWFETGHLGSFADVEQAVAHQELMLHFAYRVLG
ncbi:MAG TPA: prolyl oligopeptidase family serine peptidase [Anaerolineae bacterium]